MTRSSISRAIIPFCRMARSRRRCRLLADPAVDIGTLAAPAAPEEADDPNAVKLVGAPIWRETLARPLFHPRPRARMATGRFLKHIGVYAFRRESLERFVALPPSPLERRERLEQLRALEAGMRIDAALLDKAGPSVDTERDLAAVRAAAIRQENSDTAYRLSGRARRQLRHRLPRRLSGLDAPALRELRGRFRRRHRRPRRARHDPDRKLHRRPRRGHPSFPAAFGPAHRRRIFSADPFSSDGARRARRARACARSTATSMRWANAAA